MVNTRTTDLSLQCLQPLCSEKKKKCGAMDQMDLLMQLLCFHLQQHNKTWKIRRLKAQMVLLLDELVSVTTSSSSNNSKTTTNKVCQCPVDSTRRLHRRATGCRAITSHSKNRLTSCRSLRHFKQTSNACLRCKLRKHRSLPAIENKAKNRPTVLSLRITLIIDTCNCETPHFCYIYIYLIIIFNWPLYLI